MARRKMSKKASAFIASVTRRERRKGTPPKKAVAIAYSRARRRGFRIPRRRRK